MNAIERVITELRKRAEGCADSNEYVRAAEISWNADQLEHLNREVIEPGFEEQLFAARLDECKAAQLAWNASRGYCGDYFKDRIAEKELGE